jgi:two-component system chemotaxis response regulator CheY
MPQTILIVDDSATMRSVLRLYLQGAGYDFAEAETAERALNLARLLKPSLAIIDLNLPGMDGVQLLQEFRARQPAGTPRMPVIVLTGEDSDDWKPRAEAAGADEAVRKPVNAGALRSMVESLLSGRSS